MDATSATNDNARIMRPLYADRRAFAVVCAQQRAIRSKAPRLSGACHYRPHDKINNRCQTYSSIAPADTEIIVITRSISTRIGRGTVVGLYKLIPCLPVESTEFICKTTRKTAIDKIVAVFLDDPEPFVG